MLQPEFVTSMPLNGTNVQKERIQKASPDSGALQGVLRATEDAPGSVPTMPPSASNSEVVNRPGLPRATRRPFTKGDFASPGSINLVCSFRVVWLAAPVVEG